MKLTKELLESYPRERIFATGWVKDTVGGVNIAGTNLWLRWVAVRGYIPDWAMYVGFAYLSISEITTMGDKVSLKTACKILDCDEGAKEAYRR